MKYPMQCGFTLIELIVVMILIAILSVTALPKFWGKAGTEEITVQDQLIAVLRLMQNRAMQNTDPNACHQVLFTASQLGAASIHPDIPCSPNSAFSLQQQNDADQLRLSDTDITLILFNASNGGAVISPPFRFRFNSLGKPVEDTDLSQALFNGNGVRFVVQGTTNAAVCIESEGYIHVCT
ncbi:MAG: type II secretion system GspH family protein [Gammaproteobacteria bacterium]|nr:type II secretion system GspH family protein [Gammaproteobacteria bacterium]